jgi:hypothetical protein
MQELFRQELQIAETKRSHCFCLVAFGVGHPFQTPLSNMISQFNFGHGR